MSVEIRRTPEGLELELTGEWVAERFVALESGLASVDLAAAEQLLIAARGLTALDLLGAWRGPRDASSAPRGTTCGSSVRRGRSRPPGRRGLHQRRQTGSRSRRSAASR